MTAAKACADITQTGAADLENCERAATEARKIANTRGGARADLENDQSAAKKGAETVANKGTTNSRYKMS